MSIVTQIGTTDPNLPWVLGALPIAIGLDLAISDLPGRTYPTQALKWLISVVEAGVSRTVARVGGGRGGDLFGGCLVTCLVVGTPASLVWSTVDLADQIGGLASLAVRTTWIAAGLVIRANGDRILQAAESPDVSTAARWLALVSPCSIPDGKEIGVAPACIHVVAEQTLCLLVVPLFWLAVGGPSAMWGFLAIHYLRESRSPLGPVESLKTRVPAIIADLAEWIPGLVTWLLMTIAAGIVQLRPDRAWRIGWQAIRNFPGSPRIWNQATLAGAIGIQLVSRRLRWWNPKQHDVIIESGTLNPDLSHVLRALRLMQVTSLLAAGGSEIFTLLTW